MTRHVITAEPDRPLHEIAALLEKNAIKRVPIVKDGQLVGIVSRANLVQAVASAKKALEVSLLDTTIRDQLLNHLKQQKWTHTQLLNVTVSGGVVDLWGIAQSEAEHQAIRVAAESTPGVQAVNDNLIKRSIEAWT
jgi:osmotically-inducible protein OsmY